MKAGNLVAMLTALTMNETDKLGDWRDFKAKENKRYDQYGTHKHKTRRRKNKKK